MYEIALHRFIDPPIQSPNTLTLNLSVKLIYEMINVWLLSLCKFYYEPKVKNCCHEQSSSNFSKVAKKCLAWTLFSNRTRFWSLNIRSLNFKRCLTHPYRLSKHCFLSWDKCHRWYKGQLWSRLLWSCNRKWPYRTCK